MTSVFALISLKNAIESLVLHSPHVSIHLVPCPEIEFLYEELLYLKTFLLDKKQKPSSELYVLRRQIGELARQLEDAFDSHVSNQFLSQSQDEILLLLFTLDFEQLIPHMISFIETSEEMVKQYIKDYNSRTCPLDDVDNLKSSIWRLHHFLTKVFFAPYTKIDFLYGELISLHVYLQSFERGHTKESITGSKRALYIQIRESIQRLADNISNMFPSQSHQSSPPGDYEESCSTHHPSTFSVEEFVQRISILDNTRFKQNRKLTQRLQDFLDRFIPKSFPSISTLDFMDLNQEIDSFITRVKEIKEEYCRATLLLEKDNTIPDQMDFKTFTKMMKKTKEVYIIEQPKSSSLMHVGLHDELIQLRSWLTNDTKDRQCASILGMAGIGKTTLAKQVYDDPFVSDHFSDRVWVTLGQNFEHREFMMRVLAQLNTEINQNDVKGEISIESYVYFSLRYRRYLIVLDDVCDKDLYWKILDNFPNDYNGSRILLTTRFNEVGRRNSGGGLYKMSFLNKGDSWRLLRQTLFENELCPPELVESGEKIAENCEGLPLLIIAVGKHLSKNVKTLEYWNHLAVNGNAVIINADDELSKVLLSNYNYFDPYLKACFLYMGVFPHNYEMQTSKLINLLFAEGVVGSYEFETSNDFAKRCFRELESTSLILVRQKNYIGYIKTCKLHTAYWHICVREAWKEKFFNVLNTYADSFKEKIQNQCRLCIHNNILFAIKDVHNSIATISTTARSLLCTGPPHRYPIPMYFGLELLKILDALTIRFYMFPVELLKLLQLTYLSFTYNGKLPGSISKLWNLQYLIVRQHLNIISSGARSYMPIELWNMNELKHLQVMGSDLQDPCGRLLPKLLKLVDVTSHSCTKEVFEGIPSLKKLGIRIELSLDDIEPVCCFDHLVHLSELESLKCVVVNPNNRSPIISPPPLTSCFPSGLKKLSLSGFGYPWKYMNTITKLENLQVLKLRDYAFRGSKWKLNKWDFPTLEYLLIEDTDLEYWEGIECVPWIKQLTIRNCYKLKELPLGLGDVDYLRMIELVDCNPLAVAFVEQIQKVRQSDGNNNLEVSVHFSADDGKSKA